LKFSTCGNVSLTVTVAEATVAACLGEAVRKNVKTPTADKFQRGQRHFFDFVAAALSRPCSRRERDLTVFIANKSMIRNWAAGQIASQIFDDVFRL